MLNTPEHQQTRGRIVADLPPRLRVIAEDFIGTLIQPTGENEAGEPLFPARLVRAAVCVHVHGKFIPSFISPS